MYRRRSQGGSRGGRDSNGSSTTKVPLKGLFSDGVWKCNCDPRLPAQHFQTKNGGKNHGRWFYTCQHPQPKRCDFFLWNDEAKGREAAAVLNNSRTEPGLSAPVTPLKASPKSRGLLTPQTGSRYKGWDAEEVRTPYTTTPSKMAGKSAARERSETQTTDATVKGSDDDEFYDWPASDEEELGKAADEALSNQSSTLKNIPPPQQQPETPRKAVKTDTLATPGKRRFEEMDTAAGREYPTPTTAMNGDDVFATPSTHMKTGRGLFANEATSVDSLVETPTPIRYKDVPLGADSELASELLTTLTTHAVALAADTREAVKSICNRHVLYTRGIMKGRDVSRAIVKSKDEKIVDMQAEIEGLKSERETNKAVIRHLRRDMAQRKEAKR